MFGAFHYVSGFFGYVLLGFWFRKFVPELSWRKTLAVAAPVWLLGVAVLGGVFYLRIPDIPFSEPYAKAVDLEMSIEYCSFGVALATGATFLAFRKFTASGWLYQRIVHPLAEASFGAYLLHMFLLTPIIGFLQGRVSTPLAIAACGIASFALSSLASMLIRRIPLVGKWICG